jgi:hypothetical protein
LARYAAMQSQNGTMDLSLVTFDLVSLYQNGNIIKLASQINELKRNPDRKYLIIQDDFSSSIDQSNHILVSKFCRFIDDKSLNNYLLLGVT